MSPRASIPGTAEETNPNLAVCHLFVPVFLNELEELACFSLKGRGTRQGNSNPQFLHQ